MLGLRRCPGSALVVASGGHSLAAVCGLLTAMASLAEHRLSGETLLELLHVGAALVASGHRFRGRVHRLS